MAVCQATQGFPREEMFGLTSQLRRASVSIASNIVEGCVRFSYCLHRKRASSGWSRRARVRAARIAISYQLNGIYMHRISFDKMVAELNRVLLKIGFTPERAELCAKVFTETTRDGVYSHGVNSFPSFVRNAREGNGINRHAEPEKGTAFGVLEQWDGKLGPGILNACASMDRAVEIAKEHGMGCVALKNTNHWMRAGSYGLRAADTGCIGICWTNTTQLIPPYGSAERKVGNNPLVFSIPRTEGRHILLDMALSQYAKGTLDLYREAGQELPVPGGYDSDGNLSYDAAAILSSRRPLPIGHWKGIGLAMALDLVASLLSGGRSTYQIAQEQDKYGVSQTFIAINAATIAGDRMQNLVDQTITDFQAAEPLEGSDPTTYPGERMFNTRQENLNLGIPIAQNCWQEILEL